MHCGLRFKYLDFSHLVVSSTEFGEVTTKVSLHFYSHQPAVSWPTPNLLYLGRQFRRRLLLNLAAPVVAPAPEPAVVAPAPGVEQAVNFHFRY